MYKTYYNKSEKLWSGTSLSPLFNPTSSLGEIVFRSLITNGPKIAQISVDCDTNMTFDEIRIKSIRAACNLRKMGYKPNDLLGMMARNSKYVSSIAFASLFIGCPLNTFNPTFGKNEFIHMFKTTRPRLMFCDLMSYDLIEDCLKELNVDIDIFTFCGQKGRSKCIETLFAETDDEIDFLPVRVTGENHVAFIVCSSGTTGQSKGVCLTHTILADMLGKNIFVNSEDILLCFSPLDWITGLMTLLLGTYHGAKRIITKHPFSPELQLRLVEQYKVSFVLNSPNQIGLMMRCPLIKKTDLSSLRTELVGGCRVPDDMPEQFNKFIRNGQNVHNVYGLSEAGGAVTADYPQSGKKGTVGRLCNGMLAKIVDNNGNRCGPNVDGEICIKPFYNFFGYFNNEQATRDMFDSEQFLLTGDIGHFDDDGDLFIVDRKKDLLIYEAEHIPPSEIEEFLAKHSDIDSVCVVGIPDHYNSDLPTAVIIRKENAKITKKEIYDMVADHFADYYKLRGGVYFVDSFPLSSAGKVLKRKVKDLAIELNKGNTLNGH